MRRLKRCLPREVAFERGGERPRLGLREVENAHLSTSESRSRSTLMCTGPLAALTRRRGARRHRAERERRDGPVPDADLDRLAQPPFEPDPLKALRAGTRDDLRERRSSSPANRACAVFARRRARE